MLSLAITLGYTKAPPAVYTILRTILKFAGFSCGVHRQTKACICTPCEHTAVNHSKTNTSKIDLFEPYGVFIISDIIISGLL